MRPQEALDTLRKLPVHGECGPVLSPGLLHALPKNMPAVEAGTTAARASSCLYTAITPPLQRTCLSPSDICPGCVTADAEQGLVEIPGVRNLPEPQHYGATSQRHNFHSIYFSCLASKYTSLQYVYTHTHLEYILYILTHTYIHTYMLLKYQEHSD